MQKSEKQQLKAEAQQAKQIQKYSTDYDMTLVIKCSFGMLISFVIGLFILEGISRFVFGTQTAIYLTPELIHSFASYFVGFCTPIITFLFGKKLVDRLEERKQKEHTNE